MILYIFNNYFLDDSGFSKRCQREIDMLSEKEAVTVICRAVHDNTGFLYKKNVSIKGFLANGPLLETPKNYIPGVYELHRTFSICISLIKTLYKSIQQNKKEEIKFYVINSPITISLICLIFAKVFGIKKTILEFHDLEPEMAMHIKKIDKKHFITRLEYFLEKIVCQHYAKIIVTNNLQKEIIQKRTKISGEKMYVLLNTISFNKKTHTFNTRSAIQNILKDDFVVGYISTLTFDYTMNGLIHFLESFVETSKKNKDIKILIIGDGDGLKRIKKTVSENDLEKQVITTGKLTDVSTVLSRIDVGIIPWEKNSFSESILPTKLFEYLLHKKPVIVPSFGTFTDVIIHNTNGLLFTSFHQLVAEIIGIRDNEKKRKQLAEKGFEEYRRSYDLNLYKDSYLKFVTV